METCPYRVPLALPVFVTRRGQSTQHWQSQWHTERRATLVLRISTLHRLIAVNSTGKVRFDEIHYQKETRCQRAEAVSE